MWLEAFPPKHLLPKFFIPGSETLLTLFPQQPPRQVLSFLLNKIFKDAINEGELDFMAGVTVRIIVADMVPRTPFEFDLTLAPEQEKLKVSSPGEHWDLRITGNIYEFMLLASRKEDADTLFFQRRLKTEGDTELGLCIKNFLDAQVYSELPYTNFIIPMLNRALDIHHRIKPQNNDQEINN